MLVFIDESGDPGFKVSKGSSPAFVVALAAFQDSAEAQSAEKAIDELAKLHSIRPEFRFSKTRPEIRDAFFRELRPFQFRLRAIVILKEQIHSGYLRSNKEAFYNFFVKSMLKFDDGLLRDARIVIDGSGDRAFKKELQTYIRRHTERGAVRSLRFSDSRSDRLLQLADMCTGAIARSYRKDRTDRDRWRDMLTGKIDDVWEFG